MTPRSSRLQAQRTRASILDRAVEVASVEGLEGLTIGRLAADLELSKSALFGHFGSKETLQLAVVERAAEIFGLAVAERATGLLPGLSKLRALLAAWVAYLERPVFPGGCFFIAATAEFDDRPGVVRDAIVGLATLWRNDLRRQVAAAIAQGQVTELHPRSVVPQSTRAGRPFPGGECQRVSARRGLCAGRPAEPPSGPDDLIP